VATLPEGNGEGGGGSEDFSFDTDTSVEAFLVELTTGLADVVALLFFISLSILPLVFLRFSCIRSSIFFCSTRALDSSSFYYFSNFSISCISFCSSASYFSVALTSSARELGYYAFVASGRTIVDAAAATLGAAAIFTFLG
jgi:hypothetical protein